MDFQLPADQKTYEPLDAMERRDKQCSANWQAESEQSNDKQHLVWRTWRLDELQITQRSPTTLSRVCVKHCEGVERPFIWSVYSFLALSKSDCPTMKHVGGQGFNHNHVFNQLYVL